MTAGILKEPLFENRVSLLPEQATALAKQKVNVIAQKMQALMHTQPMKVMQ